METDLGVAVDIQTTRKSALIESLEQLTGRLRKVPSTLSDDEIGCLEGVIAALIEFGGAHYDHFLGHDVPNVEWVSEPANTELLHFLEGIDYPPEPLPKPFVLSVPLGRIATDLHVIEQVISQHTLYPSSTSRGEALQTAQNLCYNILNRLAPDIFGDNPPKGLKPNTLPVVFTYFQKGARARVVPYAPNVAFIGIPDTCIDNPQDYIAIAHELGHYLYWLKLKDVVLENQAIADRIKGNADGPAWQTYWLEEIVADVCMLLAAGPIAALSFQDIEFGIIGNNFYEDDGKHPLPILRPNLHIDILKMIDTDDEDEVSNRFAAHTMTALAKRWTDRVNFSRIVENYLLEDPVERETNLQAVKKAFPWITIEPYGEKVKKANNKPPVMLHVLYDTALELTKFVIAQLKVAIPSVFTDATWSWNWKANAETLPEIVQARPPIHEEAYPNEAFIPAYKQWYEQFENSIPALTGDVEKPAGENAKVAKQNWGQWKQQLQGKYLETDELWQKLLLAEGWTGPGPHAVPQPPDV